MRTLWGAVLLSSTAWAEWREMPTHDVYSGVRAMGMAGAYTAVADDGDAVFLNPAGIGLEESPGKGWVRGLAFPNMTLAVNQFTQNIFRSYYDTKGASGVKFERALVEAKGQDVVWSRADIFPYITIGRLQLGYLAESEFQGYLINYDTPQESAFSTTSTPRTYTSRLQIYSRNQSTLVSGFSIPYRDTGFSLGVSGRYAWRANILQDAEIDADVIRDSSTQVADSVNSTKGFALGVGFLWKGSRGTWNPSFGLCLNDAGNTWYKAQNSHSIGEMEHSNLSAGVAVHPDLGRTFGLILAIDGNHLNDTRVLWKDRFRMGAELAIGEVKGSRAPLSLRVGHNLRGVSAGATLDLFLFRLEGATWVEPLDGPNGLRTDRRSLVRIGVDLRS